MQSIQQSKQQANESAPKFPLTQIYFYLTEGCNLACSHCWIAPKFDPQGNQFQVLPLQLFYSVIKEAKLLGLSGVKLTGGEPLLHPDFLAMLEIVKKENITLYLETNGILCSADIAGEIGKIDNPFVSVSLDGANAVIHDRLRGVAGAFDKTISAIKNLVQHSIKPQVIMSIMQGNVDQVESLIKLSEDLGAESVKFNIIQPTGRGKAIRASANGLEIKDIIELGRKVETELATKTSLKLFFDYPVAFRSLRTIAAGDGCGVCSILSILGVLPTGEYALCGIGSHIPELIFGKAGKDKLADIWQGNETLNQLRAGLPVDLSGICRSCLMKYFCLGSCIAQNYYRTKSLWSPFWFCEQADSVGLFPDSRIDFSSKNHSQVL